MSIQDVQATTGFGRTPIHQAVSHLAILDAVAGRDVAGAVAAADDLVGFVDSMFDVMGRGIDPELLDCNLALMAAE